MAKKPVDEFLRQITGGDSTADAMANNRCLAKPIGCGKTIDPLTEFKDKLSRREYKISGLCQSCQDMVFAAPDEEDEDKSTFELMEEIDEEVDELNKIFKKDDQPDESH